MTTDELLKQLHSMKVETGSLVCLGCGYEHNCSIHGCAILRAAENAIRAKQEVESDPFERQLKRYEIKKKENPLTLDELREMDGEPVWLNIGSGVWGIVSEKYGDVVLDIDQSISMASVIGVAYRNKPEEVKK